MKKFDEFKASELFERVAISHYGYDGGNINAEIWFSGLERGGGVTALEFKTELNKGPVLAPPSCEDINGRREYLKYPFDRKLLKILASATGDSIENYRAQVEDSFGAYSGKGSMFKLNLYPISFKSTCDSYWTKDFFEITGFPTKELYRAWIQTHRFQFFNELVRKHSPKVIVCCGTSYKSDFLMAFGGVESIYSEPKEQLELDGKSNIFLYESKINPSTSIIITPFFGNRYGINKDEECKRLGEFISQYIP